MVSSGAIVWRTNKNLNTTTRRVGGQANGSGLAVCVCGERQRAYWSPEIVLGQDIGITLQSFLGWINN